MDLLSRLCRYDAWANAKVFAICRDLDPALVNAQAGGTLGTIKSTLGHLMGVEEVYLAMLHGAEPTGMMGSREAYMAHDLRWYAERAGVVGEGYESLAAKQDPDVFARVLTLPWLRRPLPAADALCQILTHSAHHRAQVLSALGAYGVKVPDVDYVMMLAESSEGEVIPL